VDFRGLFLVNSGRVFECCVTDLVEVNVCLVGRVSGTQSGSFRQVSSTSSRSAMSVRGELTVLDVLFGLSRIQG